MPQPDRIRTRALYAGNTPQALLVCPVFHPENPSQPIGVLQCFNKRSRVGSFTKLDEFSIRMLTSHVAAAAVNADRFNIEYRLDLYARRIFDLTENVTNERELAELPGRISSRAKELLNARRARLYFVAPGEGPVENRLMQSPFVVRSCTVLLCSAHPSHFSHPTLSQPSRQKQISDTTCSHAER